MAMYREHGAEHPYVPMGLFKFRLPFVHFRLEIPEIIQGFFLVAIAIGAVPVLQATIGVPFELAAAMVALNGLMYILHPMFGDPVFPGWITPAIPLILGWATTFPLDVAAGEYTRIHAIIALQLLMVVIFIGMGATGLAKKVVTAIPLSMRAGILMGAGLAAITSIIKPGGRMDAKGIVIPVLVGTLVCYIIMFSFKFMKAKDESPALGQLAKYGMLPGMIVAALLQLVLPETITLGGITLTNAVTSFNYTGEIFTPIWKLSEVISGYSMFGAPGFPPASMFIKALPLAAVCYIIAFGDFVLAEVVTKDADEVRPDEVIDFNPSRSNVIAGIRNLVLALIAPYGTMNGPLWAGGTIAVAERYKHGRKEMDTVFGGLFSFTAAMAVAGLIYPVIQTLSPFANIGLSLTYTVQGFACMYIAMEMVKTKEERGVCGVMAMFLAFRGAYGSLWALALGTIMHLIIGVNQDEKDRQDKLQAS